MVDHNHITQDRRYQKTESKIQQAIKKKLYFTDSPGGITIIKFCKDARISRATFYRHYGKLSEAVEQYRQNIEEDLEIAFKNYPPAVDDLKDCLHLILKHILKYQGFYRQAFERWDYAQLEPLSRRLCGPTLKLWREIKPNLQKYPQDQLLLVFIFDVFRELEFWRRYENFREDQVSRHVRRLMSLAMRLPKRKYDPILPLVGQTGLN